MHPDEHPHISITLSPTQVDEVLRAAAHSRAPSVAALIAGSREEAGERRPFGDRELDRDGASAPAGLLPGDTSDRRLSRSLLRGLSILTHFGASGEARGIVELAHELDMSPSTAHRYALTLVELGLLERCPRTRKYRLPGTAPDSPTPAGAAA
jgi:hypothetical protein